MEQKHPSMVDWAELPSELLQLISKKLINSELYLIRFRSVCSSWRRSSSIPQKHLPLKLPQNLSHQLFHPNINVDSVSHLIKHKIYLIKSPNHQHCPYLVRIGPDSNGTFQRWHPLSFHPRLPISLFSHLALDFNKLSVLDLGHMFYIHHIRSSQYSYSSSVLNCLCQGEQLLVNNGELELITFHCRDDSWTKVPNMSISPGGNICFFKGRPCVVDQTGRTVMIGPDMTTHLIAEPIFGGQSKFLVESSEFELFLVDSYQDRRVIVWIDVFRLDVKEKKWVKLTNLGDRVLFLGIGCSFSASASDLGFAKGNCVIYSEHYATHSLSSFSVKVGMPMRIFHLDHGRVSPLSDYPDYFKLFSPIPKWIFDFLSDKRTRGRKRTS